MNVTDSLASKGYLLYKNGKPENTAGNAALDINRDGIIQEKEIVGDLNGDKVITADEILDFVVNNVTTMPQIRNITEALQSADNINDYFQYNKKLALLAIEKTIYYRVSDLVESLSLELRADKEVILKAVSKDGVALQYASEGLRGDKELVLLALEKIHSSYVSNLVESLSPELRADKEVMLKAVSSKDGDVLTYASDRLRGDKELALLALERVNRYSSYSVLDLVVKILSPELRADKEVILKAVSKDGAALQYASDRLRDDKEVALTAVSGYGDGLALQYASEGLRGDREVVLAAIGHSSNDAPAFQYASECLRDDGKFILEIIRAGRYRYINHIGIVMYASERLKDNEDFIYEMIKLNAGAFQNASARLKNDKNFVLKVVRKYGECLAYVSDYLRDDNDVVLSAVKRYGNILYYASSRLQDDNNIVLKAVQQDGNALQYASDRLRDDAEIVFTAYTTYLREQRIRYDLIFHFSDEASILNHASTRLLNDKDFVLRLVKKSGSALYYVSDRLKDDKEVVLAAMKGSATDFRYVSERLKSDKDVINRAITENGREIVVGILMNVLSLGLINIVSPEFSELARYVRYDNVASYIYNLDDKELALKLFRLGPHYALRYNDNELLSFPVKVFTIHNVADNLKDDEDIILAATLSGDSTALKDASARLRDDKSFIINLLNHGCTVAVLEYVSEYLKDDKDIILSAVRIDGAALKYASNRLKDDREIALAAGANGFCYVSDRLQDDKEIVIKAYIQDPDSLRYASSRLRNDVEVLDVQITQDNYLTIVPDLLVNGMENLVLDAFLRLGHESVRRIKGNDGWGGSRGYYYEYYKIDSEESALLRDYYSLIPDKKKLLQNIANSNYNIDNYGEYLYFDYLLLRRLGYSSNKAYRELIKLRSLSMTVDELKKLFSIRSYRGETRIIFGADVQQRF